VINYSVDIITDSQYISHALLDARCNYNGQVPLSVRQQILAPEDMSTRRADWISYRSWFHGFDDLWTMFPQPNVNLH